MTTFSYCSSAREGIRRFSILFEVWVGRDSYSVSVFADGSVELRVGTKRVEELPDTPECRRLIRDVKAHGKRAVRLLGLPYQSVAWRTEWLAIYNGLRNLSVAS